MRHRKLTVPEHILALVFGATIVIVSAQVVFRYVFNNSLTWSEELSRYLFTWMIFLGAACALRDKIHIRVDILTNAFPKRLQVVLEACNRLFIILFMDIIIVLGFTLVLRTAGTQSPALSMPVNLVYYASLPTAFLLGLFYEIKAAMLDLRELRQPKAGMAYAKNN